VKYRNRGLRGDPLYVAPQIAVQHDIAQDQYPALLEFLQAKNARHLKSFL
jgi:hypothetical protein